MRAWFDKWNAARGEGRTDDLAKLKDESTRLAFISAARVDGRGLDDVTPDDDRLLILDVDIDAKDTTEAERDDALRAFEIDPHIAAYWHSVRGQGLHGVFVTRCGTAHVDAATAYIKSVWPKSDDQALNPKHAFLPLPAFLKESVAVFEASAEAVAAAVAAYNAPPTPTPSRSLYVGDGVKDAYYKTFFEGLQNDCAGGLDHNGMLKMAGIVGGKLRELDMCDRVDECARVILAACETHHKSGKGGAASKETLKTVTKQIEWGINNANSIRIDWKSDPANDWKDGADPVRLHASPAEGATDDDPDGYAADVWHLRRAKNAVERDQAEAAFISCFYAKFLEFDDGLCDRATGYLHKGVEYRRMMKRVVIEYTPEAGEGKKAAKPHLETVEQVLLKDKCDYRRVEIQEVRNYKSTDPVLFNAERLQSGERAPQVQVNYIPALAPHNGAYGEREKEWLRLALRQFATCFDTPKEFVWTLNVLCHKAAYNDLARRSKCIMFFFDDGIEGAGAGRGKTLLATFVRFLYGREHVSTTRKKYGFRAEENFDGNENQMLFNVCNEFRPVNGKGYMDELCAFVDESKYSYTEKGRKTVEMDTVCQLILTANTAAEMELTNRTKRRVAFIQFGKDWKEGEGAEVVYKMCGNHGDQWERDDDPDAVALRACLWRFCEKAMREGGSLYAPVLADVDKALGHTAGQDLAKRQKAAECSLYQAILDDLAEAAENNARLPENPSYRTTEIQTDARHIGDRLHVNSRAVARAIAHNNNGEIVVTPCGRLTYYSLAADGAADDTEAPETPTVWMWPESFDDVLAKIDAVLAEI